MTLRGAGCAVSDIHTNILPAPRVHMPGTPLQWKRREGVLKFDRVAEPYTLENMNKIFLILFITVKLSESA